MSTSRLIQNYLRDVFVEGTSKIFTLLDIIGLLAIFIPQFFANQAGTMRYQVIAIALIAISFIIANISAYIKVSRDYYNLLKQTEDSEPRLVLKAPDFQWFAGQWRASVLPDNIDCRLLFDVRNLGHGRALLMKPDLTLTIPEDIFVEYQAYDWYINRGNGNKSLNFPLSIEPMELGTRIYCQARVVFRNREDIHFIAKSLPSLRHSQPQLRIAYTYENIAGEQTTNTLELPLGLDRLAHIICHHWNERKPYDKSIHELLELAQCADA